MSERAASLIKLVQLHKLKRMCELGVFKGDTFFKMLDAVPTLYVCGIDAYQQILGPKQDKETGLASYADHDMSAIHADVLMRTLKYGRRCGLLRCDTAEAAPHFPDAQFDLVFIDADHSTEGVLRDIRAWTRKIRVGGIICGHDADWPSVQRALATEYKSHNLMPGNIWWRYVR